MLERKKIKDLNDYFLKLEERKEKGVYFYRICGYSEKVGEFIKKYYDIARRTGVVIEGKIPNPDEKNLSFYSQNTTHPRVCGLQYPPKVDISNQHNPQGWAYRWHCGSSAFRPDAISAPTTVPGNPSGSPRLRDT